MKIGIDISQILFRTGVSYYTESLVKALLRIDQNNDYVVFGGSLRRFKELKDISESFTGKVTPKVFPYPPLFGEIVWNLLHKFPIEKLISEVDVLHTSDWTEPPSKAFKVTTVHDLYPFKFPKMIHPRVLNSHRRKMSWVLEETKRIIVPSQSTKNDLMGLGANGEIIRVIPEASVMEKADQIRIDEVKKKYQINGDYLVSIGVTPLKNTQSIVKAFHLAKSDKEIKLVLIGRPVGVEIEEERNVRIIGHIEKSEVSALLSGSQGLIFASLHEGYGIPILDAFNCEVPVVTSNISSMPEVAGDAAALVDPLSIQSISEGIEKILRGPKGYISKGLSRVKEFSWEKTAKMTLDVYNEAKS